MDVIPHPRATPLRVSQNVSLSLAGWKASYAVKWDLLEIRNFYHLSYEEEAQVRFLGQLVGLPHPQASQRCSLSLLKLIGLASAALSSASIEMQCVADRAPEGGASCVPCGGVFFFSRAVASGRGLHLSRNIAALVWEWYTGFKSPSHHIFTSSPNASHPSLHLATPVHTTLLPLKASNENPVLWV